MTLFVCPAVASPEGFGQREEQGVGLINKIQ